MAHHPMYCSTTDGDDCNHHDSVVRFDGSSHIYMTVHVRTRACKSELENKYITNGSIIITCTTVALQVFQLFSHHYTHTIMAYYMH